MCQCLTHSFNPTTIAWVKTQVYFFFHIPLHLTHNRVCTAFTPHYSQMCSTTVRTCSFAGARFTQTNWPVCRLCAQTDAEYGQPKYTLGFSLKCSVLVRGQVQKPGSHDCRPPVSVCSRDSHCQVEQHCALGQQTCTHLYTHKDTHTVFLSHTDTNLFPVKHITQQYTM